MGSERLQLALRRPESTCSAHAVSRCGSANDETPRERPNVRNRTAAATAAREAQALLTSQRLQNAVPEPPYGALARI